MAVYNKWNFHTATCNSRRQWKAMPQTMPQFHHYNNGKDYADDVAVDDFDGGVDDNDDDDDVDDSAV